jgi:papain fold toxin 1 (glutamine deamidase) of polymorphic toxin system
MIARILLCAGATAVLMLLGSADVAASGPCGDVQYSSSRQPTAEPSPAANPFEPKKASPACRNAARTGSIAAGGAGVVAAGTVLARRVVHGGSPAGALPAAPPPPIPPSRMPRRIRQLHAGNTRHKKFKRMFPNLIGRNLLFELGTPEVTLNCLACCVTAEYIFRGQHAIATPRYGVDTVWDRFPGDFHQWIPSALGRPDAQWQAMGGFAAIAWELTAAGDGSRAIVYGQILDATGTPGGHVFNAVNREGVVCFVDLQTGTWAYPQPYHWFEMLRTN